MVGYFWARMKPQDSTSSIGTWVIVECCGNFLVLHNDLSHYGLDEFEDYQAITQFPTFMGGRT
jgi:hypothetical protein